MKRRRKKKTLTGREDRSHPPSSGWNPKDLLLPLLERGGILLGSPGQHTIRQQQVFDQRQTNKSRQCISWLCFGFSQSLSLSLSLLSYNGIKTTNKRWCYFFSHCSSSKAPQIVKLCLVKFPLASGLV